MRKHSWKESKVKTKRKRRSTIPVREEEEMRLNPQDKEFHKIKYLKRIKSNKILKIFRKYYSQKSNAYKLTLLYFRPIVRKVQNQTIPARKIKRICP